MPSRTVLVEAESDEPCGVLIAEIERKWKILEAALTLELELLLLLRHERNVSGGRISVIVVDAIIPIANAMFVVWYW